MRFHGHCADLIKKLMCIFSFTEISARKFSYQQKKKLGGLCTETMTT